MLPDEIFLNIFSYLPVNDLNRISRVSSLFSKLSSDDMLWKIHCARDWRLYINDEPNNWKQKYIDHYKKFGKYISCYSVVKKLWNRLERWMTLNVPKMLSSLQDGASEEQLDEVEAKYQIKYSLEARCFYRIHNGQKKLVPCGLLAGYRLLNLEQVKQCYFKELRGIPIYFGQFGFPSRVCINKQGKIVVFTHDDHELEISSDFITYLQTYVECLEKKDMYITRSDGDVDIFPRPSSDTITRGVRIQVSPLFFQERSSITMKTYFFAYKVCVTNESSRDTVQVLRRYWRIVDANKKVEEVRGEAIVGHKPILKIGQSFEYVSYCPLPTPDGSMGGSFTVLNHFTGQEFEALIKPFRLTINRADYYEPFKE